MLDFLYSMLSTPEAQADPHYWSAVLLSHAFIGAVTVLAGGLLLRDAILGVFVCWIVWGVWEAAQIALFSAPLLDALTDLSANMAGGLLAYALWTRRARLAGIVAALIFAFAGWRISREGRP